MKILAYCPLNSASIESSLGTADYSYFFVMQRFLPLLETVGEVEVLSEPPDDELVARYQQVEEVDRKSTRLNSSHDQRSYAVFCLKKKNSKKKTINT